MNKVTILIERCDDCPFFDDEWNPCRCGHIGVVTWDEDNFEVKKEIPREHNDFDAPIPDWCPLLSKEINIIGEEQ